MKRVLKFRAWNRIVKRMSDPVEIQAFPPDTQWQNLDLMQFTGLRDRNGREIYEGDIILNGCDMIHAVTVDDLHGYRFMFGLDNLTSYDAHTGAVIGNIYENPALLDLKEEF